jgi:DNA mismatch endonuclease (patch repair protein)
VSKKRKIYGLEQLRETLKVSEPTSKAMRANRAVETKPEVTLRRALWGGGLRGYRKNVRQLPGKPDIVFGPSKVCVFLHGCFWHGCNRCARNLRPQKNAAYWAAKIDRNRERDRRNCENLNRDGWLVLTVWECELDERLGELVETVRGAVNSRRKLLS